MDNQYLSSAAVAYTWKQIFFRLGYSVQKNKADMDGQWLNLAYEQIENSKKEPSKYYLTIIPSPSDSVNQLIFDPNYQPAWMEKKYFLPKTDAYFPIEALPVLLLGKDQSPNRGFASIRNGNELIIHADIIAAIFFMLSRMEEFHLETRDKHGRFPYQASAAYRGGFIDIPLVDLYCIVLKSWLEELLTSKLKSPHKFQVRLSHDLDQIFRYKPLYWGLINLSKEAIHGQFRHIPHNFKHLFSPLQDDPYYINLQQIVRYTKQYHLNSTFNIMAARPSLKDTGYLIQSKSVQSTVNDLKNLGLEIGYHASYQAHNNPETMKKEKAALEKALQTNVLGGRQHFLRTDTPSTWRLWEELGMVYDSTYGFAEHEGFRCGTCFRYQVFDLERDKELDLFEEPLIVMDTTLKHYRNLSPSVGKEKILALASLCRFVGGRFTLLWHNTSFGRGGWQEWGEIYPSIVASLSDMAS